MVFPVVLVLESSSCRVSWLLDKFSKVAKIIWTATVQDFIEQLNLYRDYIYLIILGKTEEHNLLTSKESNIPAIIWEENLKEKVPSIMVSQIPFYNSFTLYISIFSCLNVFYT